MIKKFTYLEGRTFTDIYDYVDSVIDISQYTSKQIAEIMEICKAQCDYGYDKCAHENSIY